MKFIQPKINLYYLPKWICITSLLVVIFLCPVLYWWKLATLDVIENLLKTFGLIFGISLLWCFFKYLD